MFSVWYLVFVNRLHRKHCSFFHGTIASVTRESSVLSVSSVDLFLSSTGFGLNCFNGEVTMPPTAFVLNLIRYGRKNSKLYFPTLTLTLTPTWFPIHATKVIRQKSEVNKIIRVGKCLQKCLLFRNFA